MPVRAGGGCQPVWSQPTAPRRLTHQSAGEAACLADMYMLACISCMPCTGSLPATTSPSPTSAAVQKQCSFLVPSERPLLCLPRLAPPRRFVACPACPAHLRRISSRSWRAATGLWGPRGSTAGKPAGRSGERFASPHLRPGPQVPCLYRLQQLVPLHPALSLPPMAGGARPPVTFAAPTSSTSCQIPASTSTSMLAAPTKTTPAAAMPSLT